MARNHFAIEKPRKISISIDGYDAGGAAREQQRKLRERTRRLERKKKVLPSPANGSDALARQNVQVPSPARSVQAPAPHQAPDTQDEELEALAAASAASAAGPDADLVDLDLSDAFATGDLDGGVHEDE